MLRLRDIMTTDVVTLTPDTTLRDAAELFAARHVSGAPVVEGTRVVGVVSTSDILTFEASTPLAPSEPREPEAEWDDIPGWKVEDDPPAAFFRDQAVSEAWSELPESFAGAAEGAEWDPLADHTVAEAMTRPVYALRPTVDVSAAADRMRTAGVHRVLVMENGKLLGIVTTMDLARAVADHRITHRTFVVDSAPRVTDADEEPEPIPGGERDEERDEERAAVRGGEGLAAPADELGEERMEALLDSRVDDREEDV